MRDHKTHQRHVPAPPAFRMADRLLATGQRLRADETATTLTVRLPFAAKWTQATVERPR